MRRNVVFVVLLGMLVALVALLVIRPRDEEHDAPDAPIAVDERDAGPSRPRSDGAVAARTDGGRAPAPGDAAVKLAPLMDRPLRVASLGWDVMTPGLLANGGTTTGGDAIYQRQNLHVSFAHAPTMTQVERMLARGGAANDGADVAIVPLPAFTAAYERLRALAPSIFAVVGWSRGRDAVYGARNASLATAPPSGDVRVVGTAGEAQAFLAVFLLDQAGVPPARIRLVAERDPLAGQAPFAGLVRRGDEAPGERRLILSTADASRLVPWVAIAPTAFLDSNPGAAAALMRGWLEGGARMTSDVPGAARTVAAIRGAPEAVDLLRTLGQLELSSLADNARAAGLSGRGAVTLEALFGHTWRIWRELGVLTTPAPDAAPLHTATLIALVHHDPDAAAQPPSRPRGDPSFTGASILTSRIRGRRLDERVLVEEIGLLAGIFERSPIRVSIAGRAPAADALIAQAVERYDLGPNRVQRDARAPSGAQAIVEVLPAP